MSVKIAAMSSAAVPTSAPVISAPASLAFTATPWTTYKPAYVAPVSATLAAPTPTYRPPSTPIASAVAVKTAETAPPPSSVFITRGYAAPTVDVAPDTGTAAKAPDNSVDTALAFVTSNRVGRQAPAATPTAPAVASPATPTYQPPADESISPPFRPTMQGGLLAPTSKVTTIAAADAAAVADAASLSASNAIGADLGIFPGETSAAPAGWPWWVWALIAFGAYKVMQ
jgi:hypothetical protein